MGLSYSRMRCVEFTTSMPQEVLIGCHQRAFEYFGGLPETILYDSMKQVRLGPGAAAPALGRLCGPLRLPPQDPPYACRLTLGALHLTC
jgi:hypothetical protein